MSVARSKLQNRGEGDLDHQIVDLLFTLMESFKEHFVTALESDDLPLSQGHLLMALDDPKPMSELARSMGFDASHITSIVDRLTERGLVERRPDEHDRRVKRIALTERGTELREQIRDRLLATLPPLSRLTPAERLHLRDLLAAAAPAGAAD